MTDFIPQFQDSPALHEFRLKLAQEFARFYAEIDKKNLTIKALTEERDEVVRMANKLIAERDEARRSVCEKSIQLGGVYRRVGGKTVEVTTAEGCAEIMCWDCFKETQ